MAIVARDAITLARIKDIASVTRYYRLQDSSLPAPAVPTTATPTGWTDTEPAYSADSTTKTLYVCDKTMYTDTTFAYSAVSVYTAYTAAVAAQATADGKNTVYYSATAPSGGTYRNGDIWFDTDDGNAIYLWSSSAVQWVKQELGADAIADLAITNAKIANLDGGKITAGSVSTAQLAAGSISTEKLAIGDFTNYATVNENYPNSMNTTADTETVVDSTTGMVTKKVATQRYTPLVTAWGANPFKSGDQVSYSLKAKGAAAGTVNLRIVGFDANREALGNVGANLALTTETQTFSGTVTMPALFNNAAFYSITIYDGRSPASQIYYSDAKFYKKVSGDLIVDGAITADKIAANAITAQMISGKAITGGTLQTVLGGVHLFDIRSGYGYSSGNIIDNGTSATDLVYTKIEPSDLYTFSGNNAKRSQLIPCKFNNIDGHSYSHPFENTPYGWFATNYIYAPMFVSDFGELVSFEQLDEYMHLVKDEIYEQVYNDYIKTKSASMSGGTGLGSTSAYKSGNTVMMYLNFNFTVGETASTTSHRLPEALWPVLTLDVVDTLNNIRLLIRPKGHTQEGYIQPTKTITSTTSSSTVGVRGSVTYLLPS